MKASRILVVEDEAMVAEVVERYLARDGHTVRLASDGPAALRAIDDFEPNLLVLDVMLPGIDGFEICRRVRARDETPIIILSARRHESDRLYGLQLGADDYVTKPFSPRELAARVQAILRRAGNGAPPTGDIIRCGDLVIDSACRAVERAGHPLELTTREFDMLTFLARHPRQVFSREQILDAVWGDDFDGFDDTVTVHVRRLRAKLEPDPSRPHYIKTVWGTGYKFEP